MSSDRESSNVGDIRERSDNRITTRPPIVERFLLIRVPQDSYMYEKIVRGDFLMGMGMFGARIDVVGLFKLDDRVEFLRSRVAAFEEMKKVVADNYTDELEYEGKRHLEREEDAWAWYSSSKEEIESILTFGFTRRSGKIPG